ncbi:hypothetical protein FKP32DRAFT_1575919, partial [Trametes sanguinea]
MTTHTFFSTIKTVLDRNSRLLNDASGDRGIAARSLVTKFVNALSAASEIGGPAACAHLLGFPDHYTDHVFKNFYWRGYVTRAMDDVPEHLRLFGSSESGGNEVDSGQVVLGKAETRVVQMSKVNDYVFRPVECSQLSLYEFLTTTDIRTRPRSRTKSRDEAVDHDRSPDDTTNTRMSFLEAHPLCGTHYVHRRSSRDSWTLNFCGSTLPRPDRGDREEYCFVMLVLFAPGGWRCGNDLLGGHPSWSTAFDSVRFGDAHVRMMKNMNVLYECQDARDDFAA